MNKIKIIGILILISSLTLAIISHYIYKQNNINNSLVDTMNEQKAFIQDISKNVFYIYKNKDCPTKQLDKSINNFLNNMNKRLKSISSNLVKRQSDKIIILWNQFYQNVEKFKKQNKVITAYTDILLEKTVKDTYNLNLILVIEFDKLIYLHKQQHNNILRNYTNLQYGLFIILLFTLSYLLIYMSKITNNINILIKKIDTTIKSIVQIENNVEIVLESIDEDNLEQIEKEDAIIESLEELINSQIKLKNLQINLENLIKLKNNN